MRFISLLLLATALLTSCTEGLRGAPMKPPKATGKLVASASVDEPGGLKVLWNGQTNAGASGWRGWIAGSDEELAAVWGAAAAGRPPRIDFARYVVLAVAGEGGVCNPTILGIDAEASGLLRLRIDPKILGETCILVATRIARIVAVPRRILPTTVVFFDGFAFEVPEVPFG